MTSSYVRMSLLWMLVLGIKFYLFVSHGGMNDRGSTCKFRNARETHKYNSILLSIFYQKLSRFRYEISVFKYTTGRYSEQPPEQPAHTSRMFLHGKMDVKIFLMFIVAENPGSVNIPVYTCYSCRWLVPVYMCHFSGLLVDIYTCHCCGRWVPVYTCHCCVWLEI